MLADLARQEVSTDVEAELKERFGAKTFVSQSTHDGIPTFWVASAVAHSVLDYLRTGIARPYRALFDLTAIDERQRFHRQDQPASDFTVVYHLLSYERNADVRIKVPLTGDGPALATVTDLWPAANWYECEVWDMFGITFEGHPHLRRILMPPTWAGHPLRKDHPARGDGSDFLRIFHMASRSSAPAFSGRSR